MSDLGDDESHLYDDEYQTDLLNAIGDVIKGIYLKKHNSPWIPITQHACFAHVIQLVVKDGFKNSGQLSTVVKRCSNQCLNCKTLRKYTM